MNATIYDGDADVNDQDLRASRSLMAELLRSTLSIQ